MNRAENEGERSRTIFLPRCINDGVHRALVGAGAASDTVALPDDEWRLAARYAERHPDLCRMTDDDELGGLRFEIQKGRFCFRLTEPYGDARREAASQYAYRQRMGS